MLTLSDTVLLFPQWSRRILPFWKRFLQAWDDLYDVGMCHRNSRGSHSGSWFWIHSQGCLRFRPAAQTLIDKRIAEIKAQVSSGEPVEGMYLTYLLSCDKLSRAEVNISVTELMLGGVDTVRSSN